MDKSTYFKIKKLATEFNKAMKSGNIEQAKQIDQKIRELEA